MGRWGYTVFQGDSDLDMVAEIEEAVGVPLSREADKLEEARIKLDAGLGAELLAKYKAKEQNRDPLSWQYLCDPGYETLILGAYMMHVGAKIDPEDRQHLKDILPRIPSRNGHCLPIGDDGFRDPGQVQYKAALENYVDGNTRSFFDPSCFNCGKTSYDIAPAHLKLCVNCNKDGKTAPYCNRECQKANWKKHKAICGRPRSNGSFQMLNV